VRTIERTLIKVARAARAGEFLVMKDIILPASLPAIFTAAARGRRRLAHRGDGRDDRREVGPGLHDPERPAYLRSDLIIASIVVIGAIGLLADQLVRRVRAMSAAGRRA